MRRALVTGAGARLGRAMALHLAGRGLDVVVHYHASAEGAEAVADEIEGGDGARRPSGPISSTRTRLGRSWPGRRRRWAGRSTCW